MCSVEDKEELEALKSWKQEVALVLETLQAQVSSLSNEVKVLKQGLNFKDEEIKSLKRIFGPELSPRQQRRARSLIVLGNVPTMTWSEADKPKTVIKRSSSSNIRLSSDPLNIGQHKVHPHELGVTVPDINGTTTYKQTLSPHASSLQLSSLQTFASDGTNNSTHLPPLELEVTATATPTPEFSREPSSPASSSTDSSIHSTSSPTTTPDTTSIQASDGVKPEISQDQPTPEDQIPQPATTISLIPQTPADTPDQTTSDQSTSPQATSDQLAHDQAISDKTSNQILPDTQTAIEQTSLNGDQPSTELTTPTEHVSSTSTNEQTPETTDQAARITGPDQATTEQIAPHYEEIAQISHVLRVVTADGSSTVLNGQAETITEQTTEPEVPSSKLHVPSTAITESTISESTEIVVGMELPPEDEEFCSIQTQEIGFRLSGEHVLTPQIAKRELKPKSFTTTKGLLSIEIPNVIFGSPRSFTPSTPTLMSSPHLPAAPPPTPVSTPEVISLSTPTTAPLTPKLHLTRPTLPTRMADELKAKGSTLKRTTVRTLNRSDSLREVWLPLDTSAPTTPTTPPADIDELYAAFNSGASDVESEPESPHSARLKISISEERITSPESSDTEDSFIKIKEKFGTQKFEPDTLRRYEQDAKRVVLAQKVMRGWIHRKRLEKIRKRTEATKELLTTELGYAKCLDLMIHHYVKPLRSNSTSPHAYILPSQVDEIFSTVEDIRQSSAMMLMELDALMKSWNYFSCVGAIMLSQIEMLQPHMPFVVNYEKSQEVLAACSKNKEFSAFLRRRMSSSELDYKTLDDFLILPVQRIPRYIMLLEAIYKYTPASHPDREGVRKAAHQMRLLAEKINKRKAAVVKLAEFCACLKGYEGEEIITESRYLVREGNLLSEKRRPRYAAILNDLLIVCKPPKPQKSSKKEASSDALKKANYKFVQLLKLEATTSLQVRPCGAATSTGATPYLIILKNANATITLMTGAEDGKGWTKDVHNVLEAIRKKK